MFYEKLLVFELDSLKNRASKERSFDLRTATPQKFPHSKFEGMWRRIFAFDFRILGSQKIPFEIRNTSTLFWISPFEVRNFFPKKTDFRKKKFERTTLVFTLPTILHCYNPGSSGRFPYHSTLLETLESQDIPRHL